MHDDKVLFDIGKELFVYLICPYNSIVFFGIRESFPLYPCYIEDIEIIDEKVFSKRKANWISCPKWPAQYNAYAQSASIGFVIIGGLSSYPYPTKFNQIPNPQNILLMMCGTGCCDFNFHVMNYLGVDKGQGSYRWFHTPHFGEWKMTSRGVPYWLHGRTTFAFCDGHAEVISYNNNWLEITNIRVPKP